jgi:hypothetical protein
MKISEHTLKHFAKAVCGDSHYTPYLKGYELVEFFNKFGFNEVYENGFPSRWKYTEDKLRELNGQNAIRTIIEDIVDPRRFHDLPLDVKEAVRQINGFLKYDKYELRLSGDLYRVTNLNDTLIQAATAKQVNHDFIKEQIYKCERKILDEDFNGAITNGRSLIEAVFIEIIERYEGDEIKNDGNIEKLWSQVKKIMKLEIDKETLPEFVIQILSGIDTCVKGLAGLSNNAADRHANKFKTRKHHAKLAVNLSMTITDFIFDSWTYQQEKVQVIKRVIQEKKA